MDNVKDNKKNQYSQNKKVIIGLTGGIGSGKTAVSKIFESHGINVIDADIIAREIVAKGSIALGKIEIHFGKDILLENGELNRSVLRELVFNDESSRLWLNNLLHPLIRAEITHQLNTTSSAYCILVAPLLIENNLTPLVSRVLIVDVAPETQLVRTCQRDGSPEDTIKSIMNNQISRPERITAADDIIDNNDTGTDSLVEQVKHLHQYYLKLVNDKYD